MQETVMGKYSILDKVKPEVRSINSYTLREYDYEIKINQNENPYDVPEQIKREILDFALERSWSRYPPFDPVELREELAAYTGWNPEGILAGNGSNEIIQCVLEIILYPGRKLILPSPTFTVYKLIGTVLGGTVQEVPLKSDLTFDCDAIEAEMADSGDVIILCSPNNPTGCMYPQDRLVRLLEQNPGTVVIVDEAYYEFSKETVAGLLGTYENLIVFRTFSKAFSLAGLRVGYGLMNPALAREVNKAKLPYNINFFSIAAAIKLLQNRDILSGKIDELIAEREALYTAMNTINGVTVYPSRSNFMIFETPYDPEIIFRELLKDGLLVRNVSSYPMLSKALRVSVSIPDDNRRFITSLVRIMGELETSE
ncbi:MAG: histidinol-phosphate transaminase [Candidatus Latescibacteria bacterium]|nr:histidinol-phosphate transaminase [Candidatus Latescibacterota bacterium]